MYGVSDAYKAAIAAASRTTRITGTITLADTTVRNITDADIVRGSLYLDESCVNGSDIDVGGVYVSEMGFGTRLTDDLEGATVELIFGILLTGVTYEDVPLGRFYVVDAPRQNGVATVKCYDSMVLFDTAIGTPPASGTPYTYIAYACTTAGVTLHTAQGAINGMPNGAMTITYPTGASEIGTCRDLLMWVMDLLAGFAWMNRDGQLEIRRLNGLTNTDIIDNNGDLVIDVSSNQVMAYAYVGMSDILSGADTVTDATGNQVIDDYYIAQNNRVIESNIRKKTDISDIEKTVTAVSITENGTTYLASNTPDDGATLPLNDNPLIRAESAATINAILVNVLSELSQIAYFPFRTDMLGDPALEPGDYVVLNGGAAAGRVGMITSNHWTYRGNQSLTGAGVDGMVKVARTQADKKTVVKADIAYILDIIAQRITAGEKIIVGDEAGEHFEIYIDSTDGDKPKIDSYNTAGIRVASWHYQGLDFHDSLGAVSTRIATTTADATISVGAGKDFETPQLARDSLPKFINHNIVLDCYSGSYSVLELTGFSGTGLLTVQERPGETVNIERIYAHGCEGRIKIYGANITLTTDTAVYVVDCSNVECSSLVITNSAGNHGIYYENSKGFISNCTISNRSFGIYAYRNSEIFVNNTGGTGNVVGIRSLASTVYDVSSTITGTTPRDPGNGLIVPSQGLQASGSDAKMITGTPGSTGQLGMWNADGDLVTAAVTLSGADNKAITGTPGTSGSVARWNADGDLTGSDGVWSDWTPTVTPGGSMTLTSAAIALARFCQIGNVIYYRLKITGTIGGTPAGSFNITAPVNRSGTVAYENVGAGNSYDGAGDAMIFAQWANTSQSTFTVIRYNGGNFTAGANAQIKLEGFYEV